MGFFSTRSCCFSALVSDNSRVSSERSKDAAVVSSSRHKRETLVSRRPISFPRTFREMLQTQSLRCGLWEFLDRRKTYVRMQRLSLIRIRNHDGWPIRRPKRCLGVDSCCQAPFVVIDGIFDTLATFFCLEFGCILVEADRTFKQMFD